MSSTNSFLAGTFPPRRSRRIPRSMTMPASCSRLRRRPPGRGYSCIGITHVPSVSPAFANISAPLSSAAIAPATHLATLASSAEESTMRLFGTFAVAAPTASMFPPPKAASPFQRVNAAALQKPTQCDRRRIQPQQVAKFPMNDVCAASSNSSTVFCTFMLTCTTASVWRRSPFGRYPSCRFLAS